MISKICYRLSAMLVIILKSLKVWCFLYDEGYIIVGYMAEPNKVPKISSSLTTLT